MARPVWEETHFWIVWPVWEETHFWIAWFTPAWYAQHVPSTGGREGEMDFAIIHTGDLENYEVPTACFFYHKVISGTDFAAQHYCVASSRQSSNAGYSGL